jgi:hypothetical protein
VIAIFEQLEFCQPFGRQGAILPTKSVGKKILVVAVFVGCKIFWGILPTF